MTESTGFPVLSAPRLVEREVEGIPAFTDDVLFDACGVRIAFTTREGGVSEGPYASLNFGSHVEDDLERVVENRRLFLDAIARDIDACTEEEEDATLAASIAAQPLEEVLIVPNQVHGDLALSVLSAKDVPGVQERAAEGADAIVVDTSGVGALLCFADCVPVIIVLPTGRFAVVHAGWRGVENEIAAKTLSLMLDQEVDAMRETTDIDEPDIMRIRRHLVSNTNVYIGPYIHRECFETSPEVHEMFTSKFGEECSFDENHIDLGAALRTQLVRLGIDPKRICDLDVCTVCNNDRFFSFRAQDGIAGRHGAFAVRGLLV